MINDQPNVWILLLH